MNASLISGLSSPVGLAVSGSNLYVTYYPTGPVSEYTTSGGTVNASLVPGPVGFGIAVVNPSTAVNGTWTNGSGGSWSVTGNWSGGNVPGFGFAGDTAAFGAVATSGNSVTVTLDTSPLLSTMIFSSTSSYLLQGGGTNFLTLSATGGVALVTASAGSHTIAAPLTLAASANLRRPSEPS